MPRGRPLGEWTRDLRSSRKFRSCSGRDSGYHERYRILRAVCLSLTPLFDGYQRLWKDSETAPEEWSTLQRPPSGSRSCAIKSAKDL